MSCTKEKQGPGPSSPRGSLRTGLGCSGISGGGRLEGQESIACVWLFQGRVAVWFKCETHGTMQNEDEVGKGNCM